MTFVRLKMQMYGYNVFAFYLGVMHEWSYSGQVCGGLLVQVVSVHTRHTPRGKTLCNTRVFSNTSFFD